MRPAAGRHGRPSEIPAKANVTAAQPQRGVSKRTVFVGLLCATAISCGESYGTLVVSGSAMAADYSTGAAIFLFFLLTLLLNPLAHLLTGSRLHSGELATIYIMMIVASAIPSWGFVMNLIPFLGGLFYFATPENDWATYHPPAHQTLARVPGPRGEPVPWGLWHKPMLAWGFFILSVYFVTLCMLVILRKQWMEHERLLFPLSVLPLELAQGEQGRLLPPLLRNYLTWVGFLLPFLINLVNGLHSPHWGRAAVWLEHWPVAALLDARFGQRRPPGAGRDVLPGLFQPVGRAPTYRRRAAQSLQARSDD